MKLTEHQALKGHELTSDVSHEKKELQNTLVSNFHFFSKWIYYETTFYDMFCP